MECESEPLLEAVRFIEKRRWKKCLDEAEKHLEELKQETEQDGSAEDRRVKAAKKRAARERVEKIEAALEERKKLEAKRESRKKGSGEKARTSTTDPEARVMKMGDGGFRPAYNVPFATTTDSLVIVGVDVHNDGTDSGSMGTMYDQIKERHQQNPREYITDCGFLHREDITKLESAGTKVYLPVRDAEKKIQEGKDPYLPLKKDNPEMQQWRARMGTQESKEIYKQRTATAEFPNAGCRNRGLHQFKVRGLKKVKAVALLQAITHNIQRTFHLRKSNGLSIVEKKKVDAKG